MPYEISHVDVWVGEMDNHPGGLAAKLEDLYAAGCNLEFIVCRRIPEKPGLGLIFVAPVKGRKQTQAARNTGLEKAETMYSVRLCGPDRKGLGARLANIASEAGVNLRGVTCAAMGRKCIVYYSFDSKDEANRTVRAFRKALNK